jgi:hypothetical protein
MEEGYPFEDIEDEEIQYYSRICEEKMNIETEIHFIPVYNEWLEFVESGQASQVSVAEYRRKKKRHTIQGLAFRHEISKAALSNNFDL